MGGGVERGLGHVYKKEVYVNTYNTLHHTAVFQMGFEYDISVISLFKQFVFFSIFDVRKQKKRKENLQ